jgi:hypothetical protein
MQTIFQNAKRLISLCLVTVFLVNTALTMLPAPARAEGNPIINNNYTYNCRLTNNCFSEIAIVKSDLLNANTIALEQLATTNQLVGEGDSGITEVIEVVGGIIIFIVGVISGSFFNHVDNHKHDGPTYCYWFAKCDSL